MNYTFTLRTEQQYMKTVNISPPWMAVWLQKTNHSVWLECSLEAEISHRKTIKDQMNLWEICMVFLARIPESYQKQNSFLFSADSTSTYGQLWYAAAPPTHGSQCIKQWNQLDKLQIWLKAWDKERRRVHFKCWWNADLPTNYLKNR